MWYSFRELALIKEGPQCQTQDQTQLCLPFGPLFVTSLSEFSATFSTRSSMKAAINLLSKYANLAAARREAGELTKGRRRMQISRAFSSGQFSGA